MMKAVVQRVKESKVMVKGKTVGQIKRGFLILLGVGKDDTSEDCEYLSNKIVNLRIFEDPDGRFNLSLLEIEGEALVVSQFTLYGEREGDPPFQMQHPPLRQKNYMKDLLIY